MHARVDDDDCDSETERCLLTSVDVTRRRNHVVFVGDSRCRELFHVLVDDCTGTRRRYVRSHSSQTVTVDRLHLRAVSVSRFVLTESVFERIDFAFVSDSKNSVFGVFFERTCQKVVSRIPQSFDETSMDAPIV